MPRARILIVEDEAIEAMDIQHRLVSLGYPVSDIAQSGEEGIRKAEETQPDLVLMDIMLPGEIDGVVAAEQIRSRLHIPVVYLTAYADENTLQRAKITEPYGYIVKPFQDKDLHIAIDMALYKNKMERKLRESAEWFSTTLRSIGDAVIATDGKGLVTFMNQVAENLTGWPWEEAAAKKLTDVLKIVNRNTRQPADDPVAKVLRTGNIKGLANHTILIARDGTERSIVDSAAPIRDSQGNILGVVMVFRDVTEQERNREALRIEREHLQILIDASPVGILFADAAGRIVTVNREAQRILRFSTELPLDWHHQNLVCRRPDGHVYDQEEIPLLRTLNTGETIMAEEIRFQFPNGHSVLTLMSATPLGSPQETPRGAIAVIQDITPLEEMERIRSEFLGIVGHELRTPLTAIKGAAATALGSRRPFDYMESQELFQIVDQQSDRLIELVGNLTDITRIEAGMLSISAEPVDLSSVLHEAVDTFRRTNPRDVRLRLPDVLPLVMASRQRITQVLANLLGNAAKFSPLTAPIDVEVEHDAAYITVLVRDYGRGIAKEKQPQLFKKFSQVHEDRGRMGGSGLGLAIAKGIVEAHGGRIWAESGGEGAGSTFSFTMPVAAEAPQKAMVETEHQDKVTRSGQRARILAIDDDLHALRLLRRILQEAEYHPILSSNPAEMIMLMEREEPDLLLLDLMLPGTSGFDLLQRIREFSGVPVIFLTASSTEEHALQALEMGADDYITKPFSPSELLARIKTVLRRRVLADGGEVQPPFVLEDLTINFAERLVTRSGNPVSLTSTEYKILYLLATNAGRVITHDHILRKVWGPEYSGETGVLRSMMRNLRQKLADDARQPRFILTESQVGYRMRKP
ncbi:MAG: response regulator [Chloroflexi bacterium]|nr:response regulator [Chloroflexota bacterium]